MYARFNEEVIIKDNLGLEHKFRKNNVYRVVNKLESMNYNEPPLLGFRNCGLRKWNRSWSNHIVYPNIITYTIVNRNVLYDDEAIVTTQEVVPEITITHKLNRLNLLNNYKNVRR